MVRWAPWVLGGLYVAGKSPLVRSTRRAHPPLVSGESVRSTGFEPDNGKIDAVRKMLISWFEENGRDLPWGRTRDPWLILVSEDRKSTRLNSSHANISYAVFCLKKKKNKQQ